MKRERGKSKEGLHKSNKCQACLNPEAEPLPALSPLIGAPKQLATPTAAATTNMSPAAFSYRTDTVCCNVLAPH